MSAIIEKRTVSLPAEHTAYIDAKVASGDYASSDEVMQAGLQALQERDEAVELWLREEVAPTFDEMAKHPERAIPIETAFAKLREHHARRIKDKA